MKTTATYLCLLALAAAACAADTTKDSSKSRDFSTAPDFGKTIEKVLARALGAPEPRFKGVGTFVTDLLAGIPVTLAGLEDVLIVAAPIIAFVGLILGIISVTKVGALYSHLGLSAYDTVKEAISQSLPDFGLPGRGYPAEGEYEGLGHYDHTQYPYHEEGHHAGDQSSYTSYVSRRSGSAAGQQQAAEARLSQRVPAAAPEPASWS